MDNVNIWLLYRQITHWGDETSARCGKEKGLIEYKIAIMLLHIHKFLLRANHSMQPPLSPAPRGTGGREASQRQWEEGTLPARIPSVLQRTTSACSFC